MGKWVDSTRYFQQAEYANRMCHGMVIDQDGADFACKYSHDGLKCFECKGLFCDHHFNKEDGRCSDCTGWEPLLKEDY